MKTESEAYYAAVRELQMSRDVLQTQITIFLAAVQEIRQRLKSEAPELLDRFEKAVSLARQYSCRDVGVTEDL